MMVTGFKEVTPVYFYCASLLVIFVLRNIIFDL
jgi:hypothetical protein